MCDRGENKLLPYIIIKVADVIAITWRGHSTVRICFIKSIGLYQAKESCLHKTDVNEYVIAVNRVVERNRNSVACGSAWGIIVAESRVGGNVASLFSTMPTDLQVLRDSGHFVSHASSTGATPSRDHHRRPLQRESLPSILFLSLLSSPILLFWSAIKFLPLTHRLLFKYISRYTRIY